MKVLSCFFILIFSACSSTPQAFFKSSKDIALKDVAQLKIGVANQDVVRQALGQPQKILPHLFKNDDVWVYECALNGESAPRVTLTINKENGVISGATWIPNSTDSLSQKNNALQYFNDLKFKISKNDEKNSLGAIDSFEYENKQSGISMMLVEPSGVVIAISFESPEQLRIPAVSQPHKL